MAFPSFIANEFSCWVRRITSSSSAAEYEVATERTTLPSRFTPTEGIFTMSARTVLTAPEMDSAVAGVASASRLLATLLRRQSPVSDKSATEVAVANACTSLLVSTCSVTVASNMLRIISALFETSETERPSSTSETDGDTVTKGPAMKLLLTAPWLSCTTTASMCCPAGKRSCKGNWLYPKQTPPKFIQWLALLVSFHSTSGGLKVPVTNTPPLPSLAKATPEGKGNR
mmetsp:Transcript_42658/g.70438  ORF Transcript_42658/g.70438 Transcript_42658/m.70438 type:complete len:229 (+) Transcript_42658:1257-1943(+)